MHEEEPSQDASIILNIPADVSETASHTKYLHSIPSLRMNPTGLQSPGTLYIDSFRLADAQ